MKFISGEMTESITTINSFNSLDGGIDNIQRKPGVNETKARVQIRVSECQVRNSTRSVPSVEMGGR